MIEHRKAEADTAMAAAFLAAGFETPEPMADKLRRLMAAAIMAKGPGRGLAGPSLERFKAAVLGEEDAALVWFLFADMDGPGKLFKEILADVKAGKKFDRGDQSIDETQNPLEASSNGGTAAETNLPLQPSVRMSQAAVPAITTQHAPPGHGINGMQVVLRWGAQSWLRRMTINNKAVASMTLLELEDAIAARGRDCRFLTLLRDSWPAYTSAGTVADYVTDEDGDRLYEKAKEAAND